MSAQLVLLWFVSYLLGALPVSYLAARLAHGIDLRKYGTNQVGAGNLWRMTSSWKIGIPAVIYDIVKGMLMVSLAHSIGMNIAQQLAIGIAAVFGHNWSVFLRFSGGRGVGTAAGVILFTPIINGLIPWGVIAFVAIAATGVIILHTSPLPVLLGMTAVPVVSALLNEPVSLTLGYLVLLLLLIAKRLIAQRSVLPERMSTRQLLLNRLLFDRDIRDRKTWMYRKPTDKDAREGDLV